MRIKVWVSLNAETPRTGPYKSIDVVNGDTAYAIGDMTHYGPVIAFPPFADEESDLSVIVQLNPASLSTRPEESVREKPPSSYQKIQLFPIQVSPFSFPGEEPPPPATSAVLATENLTIENVSSLLTPDTFSHWRSELSRDTNDALNNLSFAIVHRYSAPAERVAEFDERSAKLVKSAAACLALIRPTRRSRAGKITGMITAGGTLDPQSFDIPNPAEVPEIQKLFAIRNRDVELLREILPEFLELYRTDATGKLQDEYEPLRMAVQLYGEAYALHYWKARHILWWAAIESLYGNAEDAAIARIFAFFGNKSLLNGYHRSIYEPGDIPTCYPLASNSDHTLGEMVPLIYQVRNASAHGQKVPDSHFSPIAHPFGSVVGVDALAEAATLIIRKTVTEILRLGFRERFKDRDARENFWLYEYGLNGKQSRKRLREMYDTLGPKTKAQR
jgi:hypothetical protein